MVVLAAFCIGVACVLALVFIRRALPILIALAAAWLAWLFSHDVAAAGVLLVAAHLVACWVLDIAANNSRTRQLSVAALRGDIDHGGAMAAYCLDLDRIRMPVFADFVGADRYYATLAHEYVHWTRHPSRLDRDMGRKRYGDAGYAREELVAELGAAFLCADLGLMLDDREDHAAYIGSWLQVLQRDTRAVFAAAAEAQKAVDFLKARAAPAA